MASPAGLPLVETRPCQWECRGPLLAQLVSQACNRPRFVLLNMR